LARAAFAVPLGHHCFHFALLTNIRPGFIQKKGELSRGDLVKNFLSGSLSIQDFHEKHRNNLDQYGGFNLILGNINGVFWFSSVNPEGQWLAPGTYGLSNDSLDTPWPKTLLAKQQMSEFGNSLANNLTAHPILGSQKIADQNLLPSTGVPLEWESMLSAQTIIGADYGTRCRTHFIANNKNVLNIAEQQINEIGNIDTTAYFKIQ
jgi:uncharacterized protein with NRDE domain